MTTTDATPDGPAIVDGHFWVFGYGSLMWRPGFAYVECHPARMEGVHRSPCIYSWVHRGTQRRPGIVLGLGEGGSCSGIAFKVEAGERDAVVAYLRGRELVTNVYREDVRPAHVGLPDAITVPCLTYVVDPRHEQFAGELPLERLVEIIAVAEGGSGRNDAYFRDTLRHLDDMGIDDPLMRQIVDGLDRLDGSITMDAR